jgi:ApaG protein
MPASVATTQGVKVEVVSTYSPERSDPHSGLWFFLYTVRITNQGKRTVKLVARHWIITDATG